MTTLDIPPDAFSGTLSLPAMIAPVAKQSMKFQLLTSACFLVALLLLSSEAWFLVVHWEALDALGILLTALGFTIATVSCGRWARRAGYLAGGGALLTVAVCQAPLMSYTLEDLLGLWPADKWGDIKDYNFQFTCCCVGIELTAFVTAAIALRRLRFTPLVAPLALSAWFLAIDLATFFSEKIHLEPNARARVSLAVGSLMLLIGFAWDRRLAQAGKPSTKDNYGFWCNLFGTLAFWAGLTAITRDADLNRVFYLLINLGLLGLGIQKQRMIMLVFGALGVHLSLGHLAHERFEDSFLLPMVLAFLGLSLIVTTILGHHAMSRKALRDDFARIAK